MIRRPVFAHRTTFAPGRTADAQWATIRLSGELDLESGAEFDTVVELNLACRPAGIRVDLTALRFMDCAGLRHLENAAEAAARAGVPFSLCGTRQPLIDRLMRLTGSPLLPTSGGADSDIRGDPDPAGSGLSEVLQGYWERVLRMSMLTVAGGTILSSLLLAALVQAD
ncbi:STAS domain-containing protein [Streptomyces sp. SID4919]|uniref:STAS domain-containing protein n=1 Tax=unclassified Streptomyces TaxID=2593676 RepID=UPI0008239C11|nr:STAS domain-containing protein [Streptomyces sp. AmelKG-E11A]MYY13963.1 STAS domain-containing protein [Streptomyces sp. SID4919]SCK31758.1 anti-anti-sigma factor [Streptomyces sp. AmelKG-E11A]